MSLQEIKDPAAQNNPINTFFVDSLTANTITATIGLTKPSFALTSSTVTSVPTSAFTDLNLGPSHNIYDPFSFLTNNTQLTIPANYAGQYWVEAQVNFLDSKLGTERGLSMAIGGTSINPMAWSTVDTVGSGRISVSLVFLATFAVGNVISIQGWQDSGGNLNNTYVTLRLTKLS